MANKGSRFLLAGLAGLAAGLVIGVLFAPARGSKTRKRLKKSLQELSSMEGGDLSEKISSFTSIFTSEKEARKPEESGSKPEAEK